MSRFNHMHRNARHGAGPGKEGKPPPGTEEAPRPFPTLSTFLGIAAVMLALWLLASGLPHLLSAPDRAAPSNNTDTGATK